MPASLPLERVVDTAKITAISRAIESERPDALFHDPYARLLAGDGIQQALASWPGWEFTVASCAIRTLLIDRMIEKAVRESAVDVVVNLGAGFDARPYRLELPRSLTWIEVDHDAVLAEKEEKLHAVEPKCMLRRTALDLADVDSRKTFLDDIAGTASCVLIVTEGVLVYLADDDALKLTRDLMQNRCIGWWITDLVSSAAIDLIEKTLRRSSKPRDVDLRFAPADGIRFFQRHGWNAEAAHSCVEEGSRLRRPIVAPAFWQRAASREQRQALRRFLLVLQLRRDTTLGAIPNSVL